jgi:hypothetical protein
MKHVTAAMTEGKVEATGRRKRCEDLLANPEETKEYWKYKDTEIYRTIYRTIFCKSL